MSDLVWLLSLHFVYYYVILSWYQLYLWSLCYSLLNLFKKIYIYLIVPCFHSNSPSLVSFFSSTSVTSKISSSGAIAFFFASRSASHLLLVWVYHLISSFSSFLTSFLHAFLYLRYLVVKCPTDCSASLHHHDFSVLMTLILARNVLTTLCSTFS